VEVHVEHGLVGCGTVVLEDVVRIGAGHLQNGARDSREDASERGRLFVGELVQERFALLFGDDEDVAFAQRADVEEGQYPVVLVDFVARDRSVDDFVEYRLSHDSA
jgi:hypothetical protein